MKTTTTIIYPALALALVWLAPSQLANAQCPQICDGMGNTAIGINAFFTNAIGSDNTATGESALFSNISGAGNTATGFQALYFNTTGIENTANGLSALQVNTTGNFNTATGSGALFANTTGSGNTAIGLDALENNGTGNDNTASGFWALFKNTIGFNNTATGAQALYHNATGSHNTADGEVALQRNTTGSNNTAVGQSALGTNTIGNNNIAIGTLAGFNLTTGSNNIDIFDRGVGGEANTIRIGKAGTQQAAFIAGISGATVPTGVAVIIDTDGHLGTTTSSARFKEAIQPMDKTSEAILALQPVTFRYKHDLDPAGVPQFGLVAEQVEKVNPDLVARDEQGKPYTVRYEAVNAMLLNEFLKEHKAFVEEHRTVLDLKAEVAEQQKQIEALTAGLQKVSAQLELSKSAPQTVLNNP